MKTLPSFRFIYRHNKKRGEIYCSYYLCAAALLIRQQVPVNTLTLSAFHINWRYWFQRKPAHLLLTQFLKQFLALLSANVPILEAVLLLKQTHSKKNIREMAEAIFNDLERGAALSHAFAKMNAFGKSAISLLTLAENTGSLIPALTQLIEQREQRDKLNTQIRQALRYPLILLTLSLAIIILLLVVMIPQFSMLYQQMGNELPASTQWLLAISSGLQHYGLFIFGALFFLISVFFYLFRHYAFFQKALHYFVYYCPGMNYLIKLVIQSRILHCLAIALKAQSPVLTALSYAKDAANHVIYEQSLDRIIQQMQQGTSLYEAFSNVGSFNSDILHLIRIGEESGQLAEMVTEIAALTQQKTESGFTQMSQWAEPAMMLVIGSLIAFILISLYGPILSLGQQIG